MGNGTLYYNTSHKSPFDAFTIEAEWLDDDFGGENLFLTFHVVEYTGPRSFGCYVDLKWASASILEQTNSSFAKVVEHIICVNGFFPTETQELLIWEALSAEINKSNLPPDAY